MMRDAQVRLLRRKLMEGKTQESAAAAAGITERSARRWKKGLYPSQRRKPHTWRIRDDPFVDVFDAELVIATTPRARPASALQSSRSTSPWASASR